MAPERRGAPSLGGLAVIRQLRSQPAVVISIGVAVLVTAFLVAAAPRLLRDASTDDLYATVSVPVPAQRNIRVEQATRIGAGPVDDPLRNIRRSGETFAETRIPPAMGAVISGSQYVVTSPQFAVSPERKGSVAHPFPTFVRFRYQSGVEDHIRLVEGAMPAQQEPVPTLIGDGCPEGEDETERLRRSLETGAIDTEALDCRLEDLPHFQIAVSRETAEAMGLEIGDRTLLRPDPSDSLFYGVSGDSLSYRMVMSISGIIDLDDSALEYWYGDTSLHIPAIRENADLRIVYASGLMSPADYGAMVSTLGQARWSFVWRHFVDPGLVQNADVGTLISELIPFQTNFSTLGALPDDPRVRTQLSDLLMAHQRQRTQTIALMSLSVAGLFTVAVAVTFLLALLMTARQRWSIVLNRNRGASPAQLALTRAYEGLILAVPAGLAGYWTAAALLPGPGALAAYRGVSALVAATVSAMVIAGMPLFARRLGELQRGLPDEIRKSGRRLVGEALVLVLAAGAVVLLRRRGQVDVPPGEPTVDLLLAATPALLGLASGMVASRVYPVLVAFLTRAGARRMGVVAFVGFRRVVGRSLTRLLPVLVIVLCVAMACFTSVTRTSMTRGQEMSSWQAVGADYAIMGFRSDVSLPSSLVVDELVDPSDSALGATFPDSQVITETGRALVDVLAIDGPSYQAMTEGTPGDVALPPFMTGAPEIGVGTEERPLPVIVSEHWPSDRDVSPGDVFVLDLGRLELVAVAAEARDHHPGLAGEGPFVVADLNALASISEYPVTPTVAYLRAPRSDGSRLRATVRDQSPSARVVSRYQVLDQITGDPFVEWAGRGMAMVVVFASLFSIIAAVSSLALGTATRRRDLGYLRTIGLRARQAMAMTVIEQVPVVVLGTILGALGGVGIAMTLSPALDLDVFTGDLAPTPMIVDWIAITMIALALIAAMAVAVVIFVVVSRQDDLGQMLRVGDER